MKTTVRLLEYADVPEMVSAFEKAGYRSKRSSIFRLYLGQQSKGERVVLVAFLGEKFAGYVTVQWLADYPSFAEQGIPLIQDLNVLPKFRRRGIATTLVDAAENRIRERSRFAGIGVGMTADYGPAQRMYVLRGYVPDGLGLFHRDRPVTWGEKTPVDDDLALFLIKEL